MELCLEETQLLEWLATKGRYISLDEILSNHEHAKKICDAVTLLKKLISHLQDSIKSKQQQDFELGLKNIHIIASAVFHSASLMTPQKVWGDKSSEAINEAIDRLAQQHCNEDKLFINDLQAICEVLAEIERYSATTKDFASKYLYKENKPEECPSFPKLDYLIPIKPTEYPSAVSNCFDTILGGYISSKNNNVRMRRTFNASCFSFDDEHMLVTRDVAQALILTAELNKIDDEWHRLIKDVTRLSLYC